MNNKLIRGFFLFLLFLRVFVFYSSKTFLKTGDLVKISGRISEISLKNDFKTKNEDKTAQVILNDDYVLEVPLKLIKDDFQSLNHRKIAGWGEVGEQKTENRRQIIVISRLQIFSKDFLFYVFTYFDKTRENVQKVFLKHYPIDEAQILSGVVLGSANGVSSELLSAFYQTGTIHLFAASGMNLAMFSGFLLKAANLFMKKREAIILAILSSVFYVFLIGFSASILRAAFMFVFVNLASLLGRRLRLLYSLGFASGILVFIDPNLISNLGFQLSILSTVAVLSSLKGEDRIVLLIKGKKELRIENCKLRVMDKIEENVHRGLRAVWNLIREDFRVSTACFLLTSPLIMFSFGKINLLSPFVNLCVLWMIKWIMLFGIIIIPLDWVINITGFILNFFVFLSFPFLFVFKKVVLEFSKLDVGVINFDYGATIGSFLTISLIFWIVFLLKKSKKCEH